MRTAIGCYSVFCGQNSRTPIKVFHEYVNWGYSLQRDQTALWGTGVGGGEGEQKLIISCNQPAMELESDTKLSVISACLSTRSHTLSLSLSHTNSSLCLLVSSPTTERILQRKYLRWDMEALDTHLYSVLTKEGKVPL